MRHQSGPCPLKIKTLHPVASSSPGCRASGSSPAPPAASRQARSHISRQVDCPQSDRLLPRVEPNTAPYRCTNVSAARIASATGRRARISARWKASVDEIEAHRDVRAAVLPVPGDQSSHRGCPGSTAPSHHASGQTPAGVSPYRWAKPAHGRGPGAMRRVARGCTTGRRRGLRHQSEEERRTRQWHGRPGGSAAHAEPRQHLRRRGAAAGSSRGRGLGNGADHRHGRPAHRSVASQARGTTGCAPPRAGPRGSARNAAASDGRVPGWRRSNRSWRSRRGTPSRGRTAATSACGSDPGAAPHRRVTADRSRAARTSGR